MRLRVAVAALALAVVAASPLRKTHPIELEIDSGSIRGEWLTMGADEFTAFKGIPYAAPPVGALRFQPPIEPAKWRGVMNATQYPPWCAQKYREDTAERGQFYRVRILEDCLYLNVFAPPPFLSNDTFGVIVWIHGGGFQTGSSSDYKQEPILQHFVSRKVVFVTINYRLGPQGFVSTGDKVLPGNNGLWDQIMALKWVQRNIGVFGGDRRRVTLMGQGSGAQSASILALSPRAEGLFSQLILMSGTAISPGAVRRTAINATWSLADHQECRGAANSSEVLRCLRRRHQNEIIAHPRTIFDDYEEWVPIVDGYGGVIPEHPEVLASYRPKVPTLIGTTANESALQLIILPRADVNMSAMSKSMAQRLVHNLTSDYAGFNNRQLITEGCNFEYIDTRTDPTMDIDILKNGVLEMYSHFWYNAPAARLAVYYHKSKTPIYLYSFEHVSENFFLEDGEWKGAFHGSDLIFLFDTDKSFLDTRKDLNWSLDRRVTELFAMLLTNFVSQGEPTPLSLGLSFNWTAFDKTRLNFLSVTDAPEMRSGYHWRGHAFWNWYAWKLDAVDVGNLNYIVALKKELGDYQVATWVLLCCALFFLAILIGLAFYCTRKDADEDDL